MAHCEFRLTLSESNLRFFYSLAFTLALPVIFFRLFWRGRKLPAYRQRWRERLGYFDLAGELAGCIWIHAVSVGEVLAARLLIERLLEDKASRPLLITTGTPTGSQQLRSLFGDRVEHTYMPYDIPFCMGRFIRQLQPSMAIFMETEVWPNALAQCHQAQVPAFLVNARLSEKSFRGYQKVGRLFKPAFRQLELVIAQTEKEAERFTQLGVNKVVVSGSLKADVPLTPALTEAAEALKQAWLGRKVIAAASTHEGEEALILDAFARLLANHKDVLLLLIPRHPHRFGEVQSLCQQRAMNGVLRSTGEPVQASTQVLLVDTLGELMMLLGAADVAVMGGTFIENGGHNFLEPASWGLPIISGQSVFNFTEIAAKLDQVGALNYLKPSGKAYSPEALAQALTVLLEDEGLAKKQGRAAQTVVEESRGALAKVMAALQPWL